MQRSAANRQRRASRLEVLEKKFLGIFSRDKFLKLYALKFYNFYLVSSRQIFYVVKNSKRRGTGEGPAGCARESRDRGVAHE